MKPFLLCSYYISRTKQNMRQSPYQYYAYLPETFSWKITLVPFRKFLPIKNTSSSPFTEQLCKLFFKISGTPAGWAVGTHKHSIKRTTNTYFFSKISSRSCLCWPLNLTSFTLQLNFHPNREKPILIWKIHINF